MDEINTSVDPITAIFPFFISLVITTVTLVSLWKIYTKAGRPGWAAIIPFYNLYVLLHIVGRPSWWMILYFIPVINIVISLVVSIDLSKAFGKGTAFGILGIWFFSVIGYPILAFDDSKYKNANAAPAAAVPTPVKTPELITPAAATASETTPNITPQQATSSPSVANVTTPPEVKPTE